jgi:hypothetical protein
MEYQKKLIHEKKPRRKSRVMLPLLFGFAFRYGPPLDS